MLGPPDDQSDLKPLRQTLVSQEESDIVLPRLVPITRRVDRFDAPKDDAPLAPGFLSRQLSSLASEEESSGSAGKAAVQKKTNYEFPSLGESKNSGLGPPDVAGPALKPRQSLSAKSSEIPQDDAPLPGFLTRQFSSLASTVPDDKHDHEDNSMPPSKGGACTEHVIPSAKAVENLGPLESSDSENKSDNKLSQRFGRSNGQHAVPQDIAPGRDDPSAGPGFLSRQISYGGSQFDHCAPSEDEEKRTHFSSRKSSSETQMSVVDVSRRENMRPIKNQVKNEQ